MVDKLNNRKIKAINTKNKIFVTAIQLINEYGYDNISVEQICKEVGISIGGFYHHFKNKDGIIVESFKQIDDYFEEKENEIMQCENISDRIIFFFRHFGQYVTYQGKDLTSQLIKSELSTDVKFTSNQDRLIFRVLEKIIIEGQSAQKIRLDLSSEKITSNLLRYARGIVLHWCVNKGDYDLENEMSAAFEMFVICLDNRNL